MAKLTLNSVPASVLRVNANEVQGNSQQRADIVAAGRILAYTHANKAKDALNKAMNSSETVHLPVGESAYKQLNEKFQADHLLFAARRVCEFTGATAPESFEEFRKQGANYYNNSHFYAVLQGIYQEIITPILPAVYSEAISQFADVVEVGFGETYALTVGSNFIPIFQDSSWGASRSVPRNRFYDATYTLNPTPKSAWITAKWTQLVGNGVDFGRFFANMAAGMYSKTMAMFNEALTKAASDATLIPAGLNYTFNNQNWVEAANKIAALNGTMISNVFATGSAVALSKVLPTEVTGSTNVNMDAAIATLLGADYTRTGYLGEFMNVLLRPMMDVVIPNTQNGEVKTMLSPNDIWMFAGNGRKPMTIAYNSATPITLEMEPHRSGDMELGINLTTAIDAVSVFSSRVAHFTI